MALFRYSHVVYFCTKNEAMAPLFIWPHYWKIEQGGSEVVRTKNKEVLMTTHTFIVYSDSEVTS